MTDPGMVLWLFSALAVLAVGSILGAALWARARADARERREPAYEMAHSEPAGNHGWLVHEDDRR
jgi:hypothetical protein